MWYSFCMKRLLGILAAAIVIVIGLYAWNGSRATKTAPAPAAPAIADPELAQFSYFGVDIIAFQSRIAAFVKEKGLAPIPVPKGFEGFGTYYKDPSVVYYATLSDPCPRNGCFARISGSDPATFVIESEYAKDRDHVYLPDQSGNIQILAGADPRTFRFLGYVIQDAKDTGDKAYGFYGKDDARAYFEERLVEGADASFRFMDIDGQRSGYARDKRHIYNIYSSYPINKDADPDSFVILSRWYAKDDRNVYSYDPDVVNDGIVTIGTPIAGADPGSFVLVNGQKSVDAKDAHHEYYEARVVGRF